MKYAILLFLLSYNVFAIDCQEHPIYCQIKKNKPSIDNDIAMELSNLIYKMHKKYHIPSRIFTAILMQESGYDLEAKGCHTGIAKKHFRDVAEEVVETTICTDFGISQIYYKTAKGFDFDLNKLNSDLEYSVEAGAIVLRDFMERYESKENLWWVRYNCGNRGSVKRDTCQIYRKLVERYL